jgi:hypothetical protein
MNAESRYQQFVQHVAEQFSGGRRFLDDWSHEPIADEAEVTRLASDGLCTKRGDQRSRGRHRREIAANDGPEPRPCSAAGACIRVRSSVRRTCTFAASASEVCLMSTKPPERLDAGAVMWPGARGNRPVTYYRANDLG